MLPAERPIGAHLPLATGMVRAADRASEIGASALQVFADNPAAWKRRDEPASELPAFRERLASLGIQSVAIHASYLINLAGPDSAFREKSVGALAAELAAAPRFGAQVVNAHIGSHRGAGLDAGIGWLADGIVEAFERAREQRGAQEELGAQEQLGALEGGFETGASASMPVLALENAAGGGWTIGSTIQELAQIGDALGQRGVAPGSVGFCLDTAHLWSAGHPIDRPDTFDRLLDAFERELGLERLVLIHLNDSKSEFGSRSDRHEHLGLGEIGVEGLGHIVRHPSLAHVPYVVETPDMDLGFDAINVARARALLAGEALGPLPEPPAPVVRAKKHFAPAVPAA
jgi:deoxyribonuclease IV